MRASTAQRLAGDRVARFERDNRGADSVEPKVQPQWLQVCAGVGVWGGKVGLGVRELNDCFQEKAGRVARIRECRCATGSCSKSV